MSLCWWIPGKTWECGPKLGAQTYEWLTKVHSYMGMFHWTERVACTFRFEWSEPSYWLSVTLLLSMSWFSGKWDISKTQYVYKHKCPLPLNHDFQGRWPGLLKFWWILKRCLRGTYSKLCRQGQGPHIFLGDTPHTERPRAPTLFEKNLQYTDNSAGWQVREIQSKLDTSLYIIYIYISFIYAEQSHSEQTPGWSPQNVVLSKGILPTCPSFRFWNHSDIVICLHAGPLPDL